MHLFQARYAKLCYNEYNECNVRRVLEKEARQNSYHTIGGLKSSVKRYQLPGDTPKNGDDFNEVLDDSQSPREDELSNEDKLTRSRLIINPEYVANLDESDGSKQYDE